jgi:EAL domain-containing protein (putative c-di-GMP-specific phosphodiesterase class I)/DNA-binding NarL/FixJ family response regulator
VDATLRFLVVEDVPDHAGAVRDAIHRSFPGSFCRQVETETAFRESLFDFAPDVILAGLHCRDFDGVLALRLALKLAPEAAFLFVAGTADVEQAVACMKAGADDYLMRSRLSRLEDAVPAALSKKRPTEVRAVLDDGTSARPERERQRRLRTAWELRRALIEGQLRVQYQAMVSLSSGELVGFEALVRWQHPSRGLLLPGEFVPVAEETGLIVPLSWWVIREACRFSHQISKTSAVTPVVSVNLSAQQFGQSDLVDQVGGILDETGVGGPLLRFEITESAILDDLDTASRKLWRLKEMGIAVDVDDFGTGYSSLNYLRALPIDALKIDRSFISRMGSESKDLAIVRSVVQLAKGLGLTTVAEGVSRQEELEQLGRLGCHYGQGFFFARPAHANDARDLVGKRWPVAFPSSRVSHDAPPRAAPRLLPAPKEDNRGFIGDPEGLPALLDLLLRWGPETPAPVSPPVIDVTPKPTPKD